ncbi:MAG TPA: GGDEF domain-containing protein [Candidatus Competibacteraceae bacterium]|nr:GGDEF domain-containing protein [Candidatus Competibacteraceae bacterium]
MIKKRRPARTQILVLLPWLILALGFGMTYVLWQNARQDAMRALEAEFRLWVNKIADRIEYRLDDYVHILRGVVGLFDASEVVTRQEFHHYVEALRLGERYPGIQGIGFSLFIPSGQKTAHIAAIRQEGFPNYTIHPEGERAFYTAVVYLEPFSGRNLHAFGDDMSSEPVRWAAATRARDEGKAALSGKVILQQETAAGIQPGFLLFVPVYRHDDVPLTTIEVRRAKLIGWVYSLLRMDDFMDSILRSFDFNELWSNLNIEIYDGVDLLPDTRLFMLHPVTTAITANPAFWAVQRFLFWGHPWSLQITSTARFEAKLLSEKAILLAVTGSISSLLLALLVKVLTSSQQRIAAVLQQTARINQQLSERERDLLWAQRTAQLGSWSYDLLTQQPAWSEGMFRVWGLDPNRGTPAYDAHREFIHPEDWPRFNEAVQAAVEQGEPYRLDLRIRRPDGEERSIIMICTPHLDEQGHVVKLSGTNQDITDRKRLEAALREQAIRDPLTGLFNRRYLDETLPRELHRCRRNGEPLTVAMLDLDYFKKFNDDYGHEAGDTVLRAVGGLLQRFLRSDDLACRYGGEELVLILPGATLSTAQGRMEELRQAVMQLHLQHRDNELPAITVSIGLAMAEPEETDACALLSRADAALYQAKEQGRNTIVTDYSQ